MPGRDDRPVRRPARRLQLARTSTPASTASARWPTPSTLGCDCLGEIRYLDAHFALPRRRRRGRSRNAICIHEEDAGILWKHTRPASGHGRRAPLAAGSSSPSSHTVGNYEYGFFWYLYQDGSIQLEVKLTGIVHTSAIEDGADRAARHAASRREPRRAAPPAPVQRAPRPRRSTAPTTRSYRSTRRGADAGPGQPVRQRDSSPARRRSGASRRASPTPAPPRARYWKVRPGVERNALGEPTGYRLKPGTARRRCWRPRRASVRRPRRFAHHNLWVTAYRPGERNAAGDYPNQHRGGAGLPELDRAGPPAGGGRRRPLGDTSASRTRCGPRTCPSCRVEQVGSRCGRRLLRRNPAMRVPPSEAKGHHCA